MDIFVKLLFGHIVGDFMLQPKSLAVKKGASNLIAALHVSIYTLAIGVFTTFAWKWLAFVFVTHFIVDRFSLADVWLQLINGRDLPGFLYLGHHSIFKSDIVKCENEQMPPQELNERAMNYRILRGGFSSIVYTVVDNGFHLISMYYAYPYLV